jgi:hypothetical protein
MSFVGAPPAVIVILAAPASMAQLPLAVFKKSALQLTRPLLKLPFCSRLVAGGAYHDFDGIESFGDVIEDG